MRKHLLISNHHLPNLGDQQTSTNKEFLLRDLSLLDAMNNDKAQVEVSY